MYEDLVKRLRNAAKMSEALAVLLPHSEGNATAKLYKEAADAIEELSRLHEAQRQNLITLMNEDPEMEWIPVTERLPSVGEKVLVITIGKGKQYVETDMLLATGEWFDYGNVTHWMPLPKEET